jgi:hypothetical protein
MNIRQTLNYALYEYIPCTQPRLHILTQQARRSNAVLISTLQKEENTMFAIQRRKPHTNVYSLTAKNEYVWLANIDANLVATKLRYAT